MQVKPSTGNVYIGKMDALELSLYHLDKSLFYEKPSFVIPTPPFSRCRPLCDTLQLIHLEYERGAR